MQKASASEVHIFSTTFSNPSIYSVLFAPIKTQVHVWLHLSKSEQDINSNINLNDICLTIYPAIILGSKYVYILLNSLSRKSNLGSEVWFLSLFVSLQPNLKLFLSSEGLTHLPRFPVMTFTVVTQYSFRPHGSTGVNPRKMIKTHLPLDKKPSLWQTTFSNSFLNETNRIAIQISLKFVPWSPIENKPALVQIMVWRRTGDKPLHEPMMTQLTDAYMWYYGEMS